MINTQVTIAGVTFKNPVMEGSGTFGSGMEYTMVERYFLLPYQTKLLILELA